MISINKKAGSLLLTGLALYGSLLLNTAVAAPPTKKPTPKPTKPTAAQIAAGKKVYDANSCGGCHKIAGTGGEAGPDLSKVGADPKHTAEWLKVAVTNNKAHDPNSTMPSYEDKIKGKDLTNIVAYLGSLKTDAKPAEPKPADK